MTPADYQRAKEILAHAWALPPEDRAPYLAEACAGNAALRQDVERLLHADAELSADDAKPPVAAASPPLPQIDFPGFQLVREISRGGQGVVYQAIQLRTKRKVALKVLREGTHAAPRTRRRFEREIELAAQLNHPNIVAIFHSGVASDGSIFYIMDYVRGVPLTTYVHERKPAFEELLRLFARICDAVQYAHQHGIIHRDLKPSNVLVTSDGEPKVLDFGLAKLMGGPAETVETLTHHIMGTLAYMSPEQTRGNPDEIDTRTDVYALGVLLYETLTGKHPYPVSGQISEILRHITSSPPARPRTVWTSDSGIASRSKLRRGGCPLDDEIETILLRALAKERERRYQSAGELARDLARYLAGDAIEAKRDSAWYLISKTLRRYKVQTALAAGFVLLLIGFGAGMSMLYRDAAAAQAGEVHQRRLADERAREAEQQRDRAILAEEQARRQLARANYMHEQAIAVMDFLQEMLMAADPGTHGYDVRVVDVLERAASRVEANLEVDPPVEAQIRTFIGLAFRGLGLYAAAEKQLLPALKIRQRELGRQDEDTLRAMNNLAAVQRDLQRPDEAETLYRDVLAEVDAGAEVEPAFLVTVKDNLAAALRDQGRVSDAAALRRTALEESRRLLGDRDIHTVRLMSHLATLLIEQFAFAEAEPLLQEARQIQEELLEEADPDRLDVLRSLALVTWSRGNLQDAEALYREVLLLHQRLYAPAHPHTLTTAYLLARTLHDRGAFAEAEALCRESLATCRTAASDELAPAALMTCLTLAEALLDQERVAEAGAMLSEALDPVGTPRTQVAWLALMIGETQARLWQVEGRDAEALAQAERVLEARRTELGPRHSHTLRSAHQVGALLLSAGRVAEAAPLLQEAVRGVQQILCEEHWLAASFALSQSECLRAMGQPGEALQTAQQAHARLLAALGDSHPQTRRASALLTALAAEAKGAARHAETTEMAER